MVLILAGLSVLPCNGLAAIPEAPQVFYGAATFGGDPLHPGDIVEVVVRGQTAARYTVTPDSFSEGANYVVWVSLASPERVGELVPSEASFLGETARFALVLGSGGETTRREAALARVLALRGGVERLNFDVPTRPATCGDGVADEGETCDLGPGNGAADGCCTDACQAFGASVPCAGPDDGNVCTVNQCDGHGVCVSTPVNGMRCDDGQFCTTVDVCSGGQCVGAGSPCAAGADCHNQCDEAVDSCLSPSGVPCATDQNLCTTDACDGHGVCAHTPRADGQACSDGNFCNGSEVCTAGTCHPSTPPCGAAQCDENADACPDCATPLVACPGAAASAASFEVDVSIDAKNHALGGYQFRLSWSPSLVRVDGVRGGSTTEFAAAPGCQIDALNGTVSCAGTQSVNATGPPGPVSVARVRVTMLGSTGAVVPLSLEAISAIDPTGAAFPCIGPAQSACSITVDRCGDVTGDGVVNIGDALVIAQDPVRTRQCGAPPFGRADRCDVGPPWTPASPDRRPDGRCNIGDALAIAQCTVRTLPCQFSCKPFGCTP